MNPLIETQQHPQGRRRSPDARVAALKREKPESAPTDSEAKLDGILHASTDHVFMIDGDREIAWANDAAVSSFGQDLVGRKCHEVCHRRGRPCNHCAATLVFQDGQTRHHEHQIPTGAGDGRERWFWCTASVAGRHPQGRPKTVIIVSRDITERKRAEELLETERRRLFRTLDMVPGLVCLQARDYSIRFANARFLAEFGDPSGRPCYEVIHGRSEPCEECPTFRVFETNAPETWEWTTPDNHAFMVYAEAFPGIGGDEPMVLEMAVDITRCKRAEAERERLMSAIEQAGEIVVITGPDGTIQYVNPAFETVTGYTRAEAVGQNPRILKSGKQNDAFYRDLWETITSGKTWQRRMVNKRKDGTFYSEEATISPVHDNAGAIVNYVAVKRDITEELKLEEHLRQAQKMEAVGQLAAGVAHDFNNLLMIIMGTADLARGMLQSDNGVGTLLDVIAEAGQHAKEVTRSLLTFSRRLPTDKLPVNPCKLVDESARLLRRLLPRSIELQVDTRCTPVPRINADEMQIKQAVMNLAINARDAMPDGGTLRIAVSRAGASDIRRRRASADSDGCFVLLAVSDTGKGMTPEVQSRIFEPFFTTKAREQGTGLGLATVHGIVVDHGGWIDVQSEVGVGTTFTVILPCLAPAATAEVSCQRAIMPRGAGELVLLAEDDSHVRGVVARMLHTLGYECIRADSGSALLEDLERHGEQVRLLIIDVDLAGRNGLDCLLEIREGGGKTPAIVVTGNVMLDRDQFDEATALLRKPFDMRRLARTISDVIGTAAHEEEQP